MLCLWIHRLPCSKQHWQMQKTNSVEKRCVSSKACDSQPVTVMGAKMTQHWVSTYAHTNHSTQVLDQVDTTALAYNDRQQIDMCLQSHFFVDMSRHGPSNLFNLASVCTLAVGWLSCQLNMSSPATTSCWLACWFCQWQCHICGHTMIKDLSASLTWLFDSQAKFAGIGP